jgi:hypothetical protein
VRRYNEDRNHRSCHRNNVLLVQSERPYNAAKEGWGALVAASACRIVPALRPTAIVVVVLLCFHSLSDCRFRLQF